MYEEILLIFFLINLLFTIAIEYITSNLNLNLNFKIYISIMGVFIYDNIYKIISNSLRQNLKERNELELFGGI